MRKVRIRSMEDLKALPEGEWLEAVDGLRWNAPHPTRMEATRRRVDIEVPESVRAEFPFREGEELKASLRGSVLTVRRATPAKGKRKPAG
jgi:hypothetical protein